MSPFPYRLAALGFALLATLSPAQEARPPESAPTVIRSNVREVVLDVVARRKNLSLSTRLKASDFTITEDGVPQTIRSFRLVGGREARVIAPPSAPSALVGAPAATTAAAAPISTREPNFVSIVFDEMGPDSRQNALNAATDFLDQEFQDNTEAAVFHVNLRLNAIHGFTNDRAALAAAVRSALNGNGVDLAASPGNVLNETNYTISGGQSGVTVNSSIDLTHEPDFSMSSAASNPLSESQTAVAAMVTQQRGMVDDIAGMKTWDALLRIIRWESALPGRKTVLYLSEGVVDPPARHDFIRAVVSAANRAHVTFYCIDVRGLIMKTSNGVSVALNKSAGATSMTQAVMSSDPAVAMAQAQEMDQVEQSLSAHVQLNMNELAEGTGGFSVFNTNDFKKSMARIMEDVRTHYELSYVPASELYDGKYRKVKVTVKDPDMLLQTRDGYFALPELNGEPVQPFEVSALHVLNDGPRNDFGFRAAAMRFQPVREGYNFEMSFAMPLANLTMPPDGNTHKARVHAVFFALVKDAGGQVVGRVSREIDRDIPEGQLEQFRHGETILTLPFEAAAGKYTIEAVVMDPEGNRASSKRISLVVPRPGESSVSSVEVVHGIQPLATARDPGDPLEFAGGKVTPALSQSASAEAGIALFFVVYADRDAVRTSPVKPRITVEFFRDGKAVVRAKPDVGLPDELNSFPILQYTKLPAGEYLARVTVEQGGRVSRESTMVSVIP
jgi:VWFA-related protein